MRTYPKIDVSSHPFRSVRLGINDLAIDRRADGSIYFRHPRELAPYPDRMTDRLVHWAAMAPDRVFIARRDRGGLWREITYARALAAARSIGEAMLRRGLSVDRPLVILSGNDLEHAMLALGADYAGIAYAPISPAYSTIANDYRKIRHVIDLLTPGLVFAASGAEFGPAIEAVADADTEVVVTQDPIPGRPTTSFEELVATEATDLVDAAHDRVGPDTIAKFLLTSGSTGLPKAVINTQRMLCSNQIMLRTHLAFIQDEPPVLLDWLPWNHTFGGNHNFGLVLYNGGSLYIDDGKPTPGGIGETVRNLREIAPTLYFNVPKGFEVLVPHLRRDPEVARNYFSRLRLNFYAGAGMAQPVWDALDEIAVQACGERIAMLTGLGATESAPFAICCNLEHSQSGNVGLPVPGLELKLAPVEGKLEARVKGPNVTPGYWRRPGLTAAAFDEEGYYRYGDALAFVDPDRPDKGLKFDGRIAEDFKLASGTWVSVGPLRAAFLDHFAPLARDVVIVGINQDFLAAVVFPDFETCLALADHLPEIASPKEIARHPSVREEFAKRLKGFARASTGTSTRIARIALLDTPPSLTLGEVTDKGSINLQMVQKHRATDIARLYAEPPDTGTIDADEA